MNDAEHWAVLGLKAGASSDEIKSAYRRLARDNHPDRNPDDPEAAERFRRAAEAYRALSRSEPAPKTIPGAAPRPETEAREVFDKVFGGGRRRSIRGADLRYTLSLDFVSAVRGGPQTVRVPGKKACQHCGGTGAEPGTTPLLCPSCRGEGRIAQKRGFFESKETCPKCQGRGRIFPKPCRICGGRGEVDAEQAVPLKVPAGVKDGARLRVAGAGQAGEGGGAPGDLFVVIEVEAHPLFSRDGNDIVVEAPISFALATLGGHVRIPTLDGVVKMKVPAGSSSGRIFRLKGKGVDGGDQRVVLTVETPDALSEEAAEALQRYQELEDTQGSLPRIHAFRAAVASFEDESRG